jgi:argininosuccinate lyase
LGLESQRDLSELSLPELQQFSGLITADVFDYLTLEGSVAARKHIGGTAPDTVRLAIRAARQSFHPLPASL